MMSFSFWEEDCKRHVTKVEHGGWHLWDELKQRLEQEFDHPFKVVNYQQGAWLSGGLWFYPTVPSRPHQKDWTYQAQLWFKRDEEQMVCYGLMVERPSAGEIARQSLTLDRDGTRLIETLKHNNDLRAQVNELLRRRGFLANVYPWVGKGIWADSAEEALRFTQELPEEQGWAFNLLQKMPCAADLPSSDTRGCAKRDSRW
jgi:hypothetical protein